MLRLYVSDHRTDDAHTMPYGPRRRPLPGVPHIDGHLDDPQATPVSVPDDLRARTHVRVLGIQEVNRVP